ncbi:MAG: hypothetical protein Kow0042_24130 [Calditrichia bacterium]
MRIPTILSIFLLCISLTTVYSGSIPKTAYVVNSGGNTLSVVNLQTQVVIEDTLSPGAFSFPNYMVIHQERGYVVNSGTHDIMVFDLETLQKVKTIYLPTGTNPWALEFFTDSLFAVTLFNTDEVAIVNRYTDQIVQMIPVGTSPEGIKLTGDKLYITNTGFITIGQFDPGTVSVIDIHTLAVVQTIPVGINPQGVDVDTQGNLWVACTGDYATVSGSLYQIEPNSNTILNSMNVNIYPTAISINGLNRAFLTDGMGAGVLVLDLDSNTFIRDENNPLPGSGWGVAFDTENKAYIVDPLDWSSAGKLRVFSPDLQLLHQYDVNVGPVHVAVYDPQSTVIDRNGKVIVSELELYPNYPNPFNPETRISFTLPAPAVISLDIFDVSGKHIRRLFSGRLNDGIHSIVWNGRNQFGESMPSGVYFYRLTDRRSSVVGKMHLIR